AARVRAGELDEQYVDRAVLRALAQKEELGLLEPEAFEDEPPAVVDLDSPRHREVARRLAQESVVLLANDGVLPLGRWEKAPRRVAGVCAKAVGAAALQGGNSSANHALTHFPALEPGLDVPTVRDAFGSEFTEAGLPQPEFVYSAFCTVEGNEMACF